jgi:hypothetical protein
MGCYCGAMSDAAAHPRIADPVETRLRVAIEHGDTVLGTVAPVLRHLLASDDSGLFGDATVARVRGMTGDVARQLAERIGEPGADAALSAALIDNPRFLTHLHALVLEGQLTELLQARLALDPVLAPLLQALIASSDEATAALAMKFLAAQARYRQAQLRMRMPLVELPGELLHVALVAMRNVAGCGARSDAQVAAAEAAIRAGYDEGHSRLGLMARLISGMGAGAIAALSLQHAGVALFISALAMLSGQDRDLTALAAFETQRARLALALCAAGLKLPAIEEQLLALDPDAEMPAGLDRLSADRAAALLAFPARGA